MSAAAFANRQATSNMTHQRTKPQGHKIWNGMVTQVQIAPVFMSRHEGEQGLRTSLKFHLNSSSD